LNIQNKVNDLTFSTKFIMKTVKEKIDVRDQEEWYDELFTGTGGLVYLPVYMASGSDLTPNRAITRRYDVNQS
jgi:hypothetical protein